MRTLVTCDAVMRHSATTRRLIERRYRYEPTAPSVTSEPDEDAHTFGLAVRIRVR